MANTREPSAIAHNFEKYRWILEDRKLGIKSELAKAIPAQRGTINGWLADSDFHEKVQSEKGTPRGKKRVRFLECLEQCHVREESKRTNFKRADSLRQKEWRNRLSRWMRRFYEIESPKRIASPFATTELRLKGGTETILWLPQSKELVSLLMKPEWCPNKLTKLEAVDNPAPHL